MASMNPFDLLGDDDNDDPFVLIAKQQKKIEAKKPAPVVSQPPVKLPSKPLPPAQAVRESRNNAAAPRGGGGQVRGRGGGRGSGFGQYRDFGKENVNSGYGGGEDEVTGKSTDKNDERRSYTKPGQTYRGGGRRGGYVNGEVREDSERPPRRMFERHSGTGRGNELKRAGSGKGNWGTQADDVITQVTEEVVNAEDYVVVSEKQPEQDIPASETKEGDSNVTEEKEPEDKEMTLEEYEKIREEKRKALLSMKAEERKVVLDKELKSMQQLSIKKGNDDIFIKLGSDKDSKKMKENAERDERSKKSVSINEFLKPAEGERYYGPGIRGRGRGRGDRGQHRSGGGSSGSGGGSSGSSNSSQVDIKIEDPGQFPTLGVK